MDINQIRHDTPNCRDKIFLNSAGASLVPRIVSDTVIEYLREESKFGGYKLEELNQAAINEFYESAAKLLNCNARNIAFAHDATDAYTKALSSIPFQKGDTIITTDLDYVSNQIQFIQLQHKLNITVKRIRTLDNGDLDISDFEGMIAEELPRLVAVTHIPTNSGIIQDVTSIGNICAKHNICYLLDACQSVGQIPVDVQEIKCDYLSVPGRKFLRGPRGTAILYVSDRMLDAGAAPQFVDLSGAEWTAVNKIKLAPTARRFQYWESPCALVLGLNAAIKYALNVGVHNIAAYNAQLITRLTHNLADIPSIRLLDRGTRKGSIVTFTHKDRSLDQLCELLDNNRVYYSVATKSSALIDFNNKNVTSAIRLSPHYFNTLEEMDLLSHILA